MNTKWTNPATFSPSFLGILLLAGNSIAAVNHRPIAGNDAYRTERGTVLRVGTSKGVLANDSDQDPDDTLKAILVAGPTHASGFTLRANGSFRYRHDGSASANDRFTYRASDGSRKSRIATVTIGIGTGNTPPLAVDDSPPSVVRGGTLTVNRRRGVLANDSDPDVGDPLTARLESAPLHAKKFTLRKNGSFVYTHNGANIAADRFSYRVFDGKATSNIAWVNIEITGSSGLQATAGCGTTKYSGPLKGRLTFSGAQDPSAVVFSLDTGTPNVGGPVFTAKGARVTLNTVTGAFTYTARAATPGGIDSFPFRVDEGSRHATAVQSVIVRPKVMPVGDSITEGLLLGITPGQGTRTGFRKPLADKLGKKGFQLDFVGTQSGGRKVFNDTQHEGYAGARVDAFLDGSQTDAEGHPVRQLTRLLDLNPPDVMLIHLGTNDIFQRQGAISTADELVALLHDIRRWEDLEPDRRVTVVLSKIIGVARGKPGNPRKQSSVAYLNGQISDFNAEITRRVAAMNRNGTGPSRILFADQWQALARNTGGSVEPDPDLYVSGVHPDTQGYVRMAGEWARVLAGNNRPAAMARCP